MGGEDVVISPGFNAMKKEDEAFAGAGDEIGTDATPGSYSQDMLCMLYNE